MRAIELLTTRFCTTGSESGQHVVVIYPYGSHAEGSLWRIIGKTWYLNQLSHLRHIVKPCLKKKAGKQSNTSDYLRFNVK